jgi:integrase
VKGHVYRRGKSFTYLFDGPPDALTGARRQVSKGGFASEREAWRACREAMAAAEQGRLVRPSSRRLGDFLMQEWLPTVKGVLKPSTFASYEDYARSYVVPVIGQVKVQELTAVRLTAFYDHLLTDGRAKRAGGLAPKTVRNVHVMLHKALADSVAWRLVAENVAVHARPPRVTRTRPAVWTVAQLGAFLASVRDDRFYALYLASATTGMRRSELCGPRWPDLDLAQGRVSVAETRVVVRGHAQDSDGKTVRSRRLLSLDPATLRALGEHQERQAEERAFFGPDYRPGAWIFTWENGRPVHPDVVRQRFNRAVLRAGLPPIRLHDIRHCYATAALVAGVSPKIVSERLGHASVAFTLSVYTHVLPGLDRAAADQVAALILGSGNSAAAGPEAVSLADPLAMAQETTQGACPAGQTPWSDVVAGAGFEPATSGL